MNYSEKISQVLEDFKKAKKDKHKKAFLFHKGEAVFFYDHKFIKINHAKLSLTFQNTRIEHMLDGNVIDDIFIWTNKEQLTVVTGENTFVYRENDKNPQLFKLALYYDVQYDKQADCYLYGVVYVNTEISGVIHQVTFTEPKIKELFLLLFFKNRESANNDIVNESDDTAILEDLADKINRENIKALSKVYLLGDSDKSF